MRGDTEKGYEEITLTPHPSPIRRRRSSRTVPPGDPRTIHSPGMGRKN